MTNYAEIIKPRKNYVKKPDLNSKIGRYFVARKKGINKTQSALMVNEDPRNSTRLEKTKTWKALEQRFYKDELLEQITLEKLAKEHIKNILQDKDLGAKNKAIQMAKEYIEPSTTIKEEKEEVIVIFNK